MLARNAPSCRRPLARKRFPRRFRSAALAVVSRIPDSRQQETAGADPFPAWVTPASITLPHLSAWNHGKGGWFGVRRGTLLPHSSPAAPPAAAGGRRAALELPAAASSRPCDLRHDGRAPFRAGRLAVERLRRRVLRSSFPETPRACAGDVPYRLSRSLAEQPFAGVRVAPCHARTCRADRLGDPGAGHCPVRRGLAYRPHCRVRAPRATA